MARIDSLLAIVVDQGANELRIGSDREPRMFAGGVARKLNLPAMPEATIRELLGEILTPERASALAGRRPVDATHDAGALGAFHVTLTARDGGLDVVFLRGTKRGEPRAPHASPGSPPAAAPPVVPATAPERASAAAEAKAAPIHLEMASALHPLVARAAAMSASDVHLMDGEPVAVRSFGVVSVLEESAIRMDELIVWRGDARARILAGESVDIAADLEGIARVRVHVYATEAGVAAAIRLLPRSPPTLASLQMPVALDDLALAPHGLVLVCGATGSGKSTTLAALAQEALRRRSIVLITLEDPIEFALAASGQSLVRRRLIGRDTPTFASGLRDALREDPDVILVGEMRDPETIALALTAAETGHLVLASIHSRSAASAIERIVDAYPPDGQAQVRAQLAESLRAIVAQRLLPRARGAGRVVAVEVLRGTHAVASLVREGKSAQIPTLLQSGRKEGMLSLERCLADRVAAGEVRAEDARAAANDPASLAMYLSK